MTLQKWVNDPIMFGNDPIFLGARRLQVYIYIYIYIHIYIYIRIYYSGALSQGSPQNGWFPCGLH